MVDKVYKKGKNIKKEWMECHDLIAVTLGI